MIGLCTIFCVLFLPLVAWQIWQRSRKSSITGLGTWLPYSTKYFSILVRPPLHTCSCHPLMSPTGLQQSLHAVSAACCPPSPSPNSIGHSHLLFFVHRNVPSGIWIHLCRNTRKGLFYPIVGKKSQVCCISGFFTLIHTQARCIV